jgi:hypothetical protein
MPSSACRRLSAFDGHMTRPPFRSLMHHCRRGVERVMQGELGVIQYDVQPVEISVSCRVRLASGEHRACATQGIARITHALCGRNQLSVLFGCHGKIRSI